MRRSWSQRRSKRSGRTFQRGIMLSRCVCNGRKLTSRFINSSFPGLSLEHGSVGFLCITRRNTLRMSILAWENKNDQSIEDKFVLIHLPSLLSSLFSLAFAISASLTFYVPRSLRFLVCRALRIEQAKTYY